MVVEDIVADGPAAAGPEEIVEGLPSSDRSETAVRRGSDVAPCTELLLLSDAAATGLSVGPTIAIEGELQTCLDLSFGVDGEDPDEDELPD